MARRMSLAEGVLRGVHSFVAGLLDVRGGLVGLPAGFQLLVAGGLPGALFDLAGRFFGGAGDLVSHSHDGVYLSI